MIDAAVAGDAETEKHSQGVVDLRDGADFGHRIGHVSTDFDANPSGGQDLIELSDFGITAANFADRVEITDVGADTLVTIDGDPNQSILLSGIDNALTITVDDFRFL